MLRSKRKRTACPSVPKSSAAAARASVAEHLGSANHPKTSGNLTVTACSSDSSVRYPLMMSTPLITCTGNVIQPEPNTVYQNQNLIGNAIASTCNLSTALLIKCITKFERKNYFRRIYRLSTNIAKSISEW